jgi:hypothetical protein
LARADVVERCVALDLAANITDDAAKPRAQKLLHGRRMIVRTDRADAIIAAAKSQLLGSRSTKVGCAISSQTCFPAYGSALSTAAAVRDEKSRKNKDTPRSR